MKATESDIPGSAQSFRRRIAEDDRFFKLFWFNVGLLRFKYKWVRAIALAEAVVIVCLLIYIWR